MMDSRDGLPRYEHEVFPAAPLELCLVQVKYPPLARFTEEGYLSAFKEALGEEYPLATKEQSMNLIVTPQGVTPTAGSELLRFASIDYSWSVVLANEFVTLESRRYREITDFVTRFAAILRLVATHLHPRYQLRFGLRYVNEVRHAHGQTYDGWRALLGDRSDLLGLGTGNLLAGTVEQTINELRIRRVDGTLLLRHGFLEGTTVLPVGRAAPKSGPFYLLDFDYYDDTTVDFDPAIEKRMTSYNTVLYNIFRWCVGDGELYHSLQGQP